MLGLLILLIALAIGFGAGYGTRELISRRRYAKYLKYDPYLSASHTPKKPSADRVKSADQSAPADERPRPVSRQQPQRPASDITRSFQQMPIRMTDRPITDRPMTDPPKARLRLVDPAPEAPPEKPLPGPAAVETSLEELLGRLQSRTKP